MIGFLESRYPFLASAQEVAAENGASLEDLLSSPAVLVVLAGITGLLLARLSGKQKRGGEEK